MRLKSKTVFYLLILLISLNQLEAQSTNVESTPNQTNIQEKIVSDPSNEAKSIIEDATLKAAIIQSDADTTLLNASNEAKSIIEDATLKAAIIQSDADTTLLNASNEAKSIIEDATLKAAIIQSDADARLLKSKNMQEFINKNSAFILAILGSLIILYLIFLVQRVWYDRRQLDNGAIAMLPEDAIKFFQTLEKEVSSLTELLKQESESSKEVYSNSNNQFIKIEKTLQRLGGEMLEYNHALSPLRSTISKQEKDITRLEKGYSTDIIKAFIQRLIVIKSRAENFEGKTSEELAQKIIQVVDSIFRSEKIESFSIPKGADLKDLDPDVFQSSVEDCLQSEDESIIGTVCDTLELGYHIKGLEGNKTIIRPATISYYIAKKNEQEEIKE
jgi:hypothetical protein